MPKRLAIIALDKWDKKSSLPFIERQIWRDNQRRYISSLLLALSRQMLTHGFETTFIHDRESAGHWKPRETIEQITVSGANLIDAWRLWRWQKKQQSLRIVAFGKESMALALKISQMRKDSDCAIFAAFPLLPPLPWKGMGKSFARLGGCVCGSGLIASAIQDGIKLTAKAKQPSLPEFSIVAPGLDLSHWPQKTSQWVQNGRFVFGMGGSLLPASGALVAARAMAAVWQQDDLPPWEMRMFGEGERFSEVLAEAEDLGVVSRLSILARQPLHEVVPLCNAWLAPGSADYELPEVMDCGFAAAEPVICSTSKLHLERFAGHQSSQALWVDCNNPQELAKAMIAIMRDTDLRTALSQNSHDVRQVIDIERTAEEFCGIIATSA